MVENNAMAKELAAYRHENHKLILSNHALKGQDTKRRNEDELNESVVVILELWLELCVTPRGRKRTNIDLDSDRAETTRVALRLKTKGTPAQRCETCCDAVRGIALRPYEAYGQRFAAPANGRVRRCDIIHALGTDRRIEENAAYWQFVQAKPEEWKKAAWDRAREVEHHFASVYFDATLHPEALADREALVEPGLSILPGTSVPLPQPESKEPRPRLFVVPDHQEEAA